MDERRAIPRQRRLNGAKIIFNKNASVIDCVVRDLSPEGAQLIVTSLLGIPDLFELRINRDGTCRQSKVAWRSKDRIGVQFLDRFALRPCEQLGH